MISITNIPAVFNKKLITPNIPDLILLRPAKIIIPISSGSGEAMANPARTYNKYNFIFAFIFFLISLLTVVRSFVFLSCSNSSISVILTVLKMTKSEISAPNPAIRLARIIFGVFDVARIPTAKGIVNPYVYSIPPKKILIWPKFAILLTIPSKRGYVKK